MKQDINVIIQDGGLGRVASGKDWATGLIFQSATLPSGLIADTPIHINTLKDAEAKGITVALFPVEHYHLEEFFRVTKKFKTAVWVSVMFSNIATGTYDGTVIKTMQDAENGALRQIGVYLIDPFATDIITTSDTIAEALNVAGFPVSVYVSADVADHSALTDARSLNKKWVSTILAQDGNGKGSALYTTEGYSIGTIGAVLGATASANVHERIGWVEKFDISGDTELQTLALVDGSLITPALDVMIDQLNDYGYTVMVYRRVAGSYIYTDAVTASAEMSDYTEQRFNRTIGKAKRLILTELAPMQNAPIYVNPTTGKMTEKTISVIKNTVLSALNQLAINQELSFDFNTGRIPDDSVTIDPDQDVLTTNKIVINASVVPVGTAGEMDINLSFTTSIA